MIPICYTADEGYAMQVAVSMVSMLENNIREEFDFYILADNYSADTRSRFRMIEDTYGCGIHIINIEEKLKALLDTKLAEEPGIIRNGMVSFMFARLFVGSAIPESVNKLIYIDSDTIFLGRVRDLYEMELHEACIYAAVRDLWPEAYNDIIGLDQNDLYFQSGIMLINLRKWRSEECEDIIWNHINNMERYYALHDQDILNVCFQGRIQTLPVTFGMVYLLREYDAEQILRFSGKDEEHYYTKSEIDRAKKRTYVVHYAGDYFGRPWIYPRACRSSKLWYSYFKKTPWDDTYLNERYHPKYGIKYLMKKTLYPFTKTLWLKRIQKRFSNEIERMHRL